MQIKLRDKFILLSITTAIITFTSFFYVFTSTKNLIIKNGEENTKNILATIASEITGEIHEYKEELKTISRFPVIKNIIEAKEQQKSEEEIKKYINQAENIFSTFVEENSDYFQLRFIDKNGMEIIKVVRNNKKGETITVTKSELTNKKNRDYFKQAINLGEGEIYVSELDLNIEHNEIQVPYIPTIRFATPIYGNDGKNKGIIILNIYGEKIIELTKNTPYQQVSLIDQDGFYLYNSSDSSKEWGKYLKTNFKFPDYQDYSEIIKSLFRTNNFISNTYHPDHQGKHQHFFYKIPYTDIKTDNYWSLAVMVNNEQILADYQNLLNIIILKNGLLMITILILFIIGVIIITNPIKYINNAVESIRKGDFNITIPIINNDELRNFSEVLNSLIKIIRQRSREKYEFITSASHQLRTPASIVRMNLDLLKEEFKKDPNTQKYLQYWNDISQNNKKVITILGNLLKYLEIGEDYFADLTQKINIKKFTLEIINSFSIQAKEKNISIKINIPDDINIKVEKSRFREVLLSIIANAIDYSNENSEILINIRRNDNKSTIFEIKDQGIGIPTNDQVHIFEKFFRASNAYSKKTVGSGLSITIAKKIIEGHGGKIWFESKENTGTNIYFTILNI